MICKNCKTKLADIDIYCSGCGKPCEEFTKMFKVTDTLSLASKIKTVEKANNIAYNIIVAICIIMVTIAFNINFLQLSHWTNYIFYNIVMILLCPLLMIPLANFMQDRKLQFQFYPKLLIMTAVIAFAFFILKIVCQGDPILNLVRLVLVLWIIAIFFPMPFLIFNRNEGVFTLIDKAYVAGKYLRWQQFFLALVLGARLLGSAILIFIPFTKNLNYTSYVMNIWYQKQEKYKLN